MEEDLKGFMLGAWRGSLERLPYGVVFVLDIGGEGRHPDAWNLNPSPVRTLGPNRGEPIPRHVQGRADAIPLPDHCVDRIIMERSPLTKAALREIARVVSRRGEVVLRHAVPPNFDPHLLARRVLPGRVSQRIVRIGRHVLQETRFQLGDTLQPLNGGRSVRARQ